MPAELKQQKIVKKAKKTRDKTKEKKSEYEKKEVLLSPRQRRRIYHADLTENKSESVAFKKCKIESFVSDDNT
jgi:hypothetical protein